MSTYLYLVCPHHPVPVRSEDESGQHHYDVPAIRFDWLRRDHWLRYLDQCPEVLTSTPTVLAYFQRNTLRFLLSHRDCGVPLIETDLGEQYPIEASNIDDLLTLDNGTWHTKEPSDGAATV